MPKLLVTLLTVPIRAGIKPMQPMRLHWVFSPQGPSPCLSAVRWGKEVLGAEGVQLVYLPRYCEAEPGDPCCQTELKVCPDITMT